MEQSESPIDIVLYIALSEEFNTALEELGDRFDHFELDNVALTCFRGLIRSEISSKAFRVLVVPAGKMGTNRASSVTTVILDKYHPKNIVVLGIAGSLVDELQPGDVFIPDRIIEYLANTAAVGVDNWKLQTSGNHFAMDPRLVNRFQLFSVTQKNLFDNWRRKAKERFGVTIDESTLASMNELGLKMRSTINLYTADDRVLASGPIVGKGVAFANWLKKQVDRKTVAIEMESAGVCDAAMIRTPAPRAIAIRGISDFADDRKEILEKITSGGFRKLAVKNAITLFIAAIQAGLFEDEYNKIFSDVEIISKKPLAKINLELDKALDYSEKGLELFSEKKYDKAIEAFVESIKLDPNNAFVWNYKGLVLFRKKKYDEAIEAFDESIKLDPDNALVWNYKGLALFRKKKYDEAIESFDESIRLDTNYAWVRNNKGLVLYNQQKYDDAIEAFDESIRLDPKYAWAWYHKGSALEELKKYDEAIIAFEESTALDQNNAYAWNHKGNVLKLLGRDKEVDIAFANSKKLEDDGESFRS